jgi:hypothetical protein
MIKYVPLLLLLAAQHCNADEWPTIKFPDTATVQIVADNMKMHGYPMRTWFLKDKKSQMVMASFFKKQWQADSDKFDAQMFNGDYVINSLQSPYLLTARIHNEYDGVIVYVGITKNIDETQLNSDANYFPTLNKSKVISDIQSEDLYKKGRNLVIQSNQSLSQNYHYYRRLYQRQGWLENTAVLDVSSGKAALQMSQGINTVDISLNTKNSKVLIVVNQVMEGH